MLPISVSSLGHSNFQRSSSLGSENRSRSDSDIENDSGYDGSRSSFESYRSAHGSFHHGLEEVVVTTPDTENAPNTMALCKMLTSIFSPHINTDNRDSFSKLIHDRSVRLNEMGETPASVDAVLAKGQRLDRLSCMASGAITSVPFGAASRITDKVSVLTAFATTPAQIGAIAGTFAGVLDTVGSKALEKAVSNTLWLGAKEDELAPVMCQASQVRKPSDAKKMVELGVSYQTYSLRNVARIGLSALTTGMSTAKTTAEVDSWTAAIGSPVAGAGAGLGVHSFNGANHRIGPSYLLGKKDWEAAFVELKEAHPVKTPLVNGAKRLAKVPMDTVMTSGDNIKELLSYKSVVRNVGMLGGGFAGILQAKSFASQSATQANFSKAAVAAIGQSMLTATMVPVIVSWTSSDTLSHNGMQKLKSAASYASERLAALRAVPQTPTGAVNNDPEQVDASQEVYHTANEDFLPESGGVDDSKKEPTPPLG